jgi:hypothetical protein
MKHRTFVSVALVSALGAGLGACSSDSSPSSPAPAPAPTKAIASAPGSTQVSQMTPAEQQQASQDMQTYFAANISPETAKQLGCGTMALMMAGMSGSDPKAACQSMYDQCMQSPATADAGADTSTTSAPPASTLTTCTATVDEVNQCLAEEVAGIKAMAAAMNCNNVGADAAALMTTPAMPACEAIAAKCPGLTEASTADAGTSA